jgi:opacity protein-like surface antigen
MKKLIAPLFLATALAASAQNFTTGFDVGHLVDNEETYYAGRIGYVLKTDEKFSQQIELEIGYADSRNAAFKADLMPVTLNYRLTSVGSPRLGWFAGVGAGYARAELDGVGIAGPVRLHDTLFAAQAFAGVSYNFTPAAALNVGAKYLWADDAKFAGTRLESGDDVALTAGLSFRF